jgi:fission process protein 1
VRQRKISGQIISTLKSRIHAIEITFHKKNLTMAKKDNQTDDPLGSIPHERKEPRPDFSKPLPRSKLPSELQQAFERDSDLWETISEGKAGESTESNVRYAAYAARLRTIMLSAHRYVAYTSDIGESFRPVAHPNWVRAAYGISWAYLIGDVSHEGYKAYKQNQRILAPETDEDRVESELHGKKIPAIEDFRAVMAQRAVFQSIASMGLPAFTIHSIVRYSGQAFKNVKNVRLRTWGPIGLGLAAVPALPFMFDHPIETATEYVFHKAFETIGGPDAVGHGKAASIREKLKEVAEKKEL